MISTKRKIETEQDRYGGFSTNSNPNVSYFANNSFSSPYEVNDTSYDFDNETSTDNDFFTFNQTQTEEEQESTYETPQFNIDTTPVYELEKEYKVEELSPPNEGDEFCIVKTFMPNVQRKEQPVVTTPTVKKQRAVLNSRGKIFVSMYLLVATLLIAFCIYNAVAISSLSATISATQSEYNSIKNEVTLLESDYSNFNSSMENLVPDNFNSISSSNTVSVSIKERPVYVEAESTTNAFDKICEFLSNIFN